MRETSRSLLLAGAQVEITLPPKLPAGGRREEVLSRLSELEETHQALSIYLW